MRTLAIVLRVCCLLSAPWLSHAHVGEAWVQRYRAGSSQHLWAGPVVGTNGDVHITGVLTDSADPQFATVKYDSAGNLLWAARYNGATNQPDIPSAIRLLPDGHVIVAGKSGPYHSNIFATVKYSPAGAEVWARHHNVVLDGDHRTVLAVDACGGIYVAGATSSLAADSEVVTLKYSPDGVLQWQATFTGLAGSDTVAAITADADGNAYIAGRSQSGSDFDYYVVKYDTNGNELWRARYDGPLRQLDSPEAILVDMAGNVYVTGSSLGRGSGGIARYESATVKYDSLGNEVWVARYALPGSESWDGRGGMSFDNAGNILITGTSTGPQDQQCALIKYDPDGNRLWTARYNHAANRFDGAYDLAVDAEGSSYVAAISDGPEGWQFVTLKYDRFGNRLWAARLTPDGIFDYPVGIDLRSNGEVYVAGQSRYFEGPGGFLMIKYFQTNGPAGAPVILTGPASQTAPGETNVTFSVTVSPDTSGPLFYQWRFNGMVLPDATSSSLMLSNVALEHSGQYSVEVTNQFGATASPEADLLVLILPVITSEPQHQFAFAGTEVTFTVSAFGTEPFSYRWFHDEMPMPAQEQPLLTLTNLQVANAGDYRVVVSNPSGSTTSAVARLTVSRQVQQDWVRTYDGPTQSDDVNPLVKLDGLGNVYVAGTSPGSTGRDVVVIKYDASGTALWTSRYSAQSNSAETVSAMVIDGAGDVWVAGATTSPDMQQDALTLKFSSAGALLWAAQFGMTNLFETANAVAIDSSGNGYVTGQTGQDFLTVKYDSAGNQMWVADFNGSGNAIDTARSIVAAGTNVYVVGSSWNGSNLDFLTLNYDSQGHLIWQRVYDASETDHAVAVAVDPWGNVIVTGNSYGTINYDEFGSDYVVLKYAPDGTRLWSARYDGFMNAEDYPTALAVDAQGNIYVTGHSDFESEDSGVRQFATLKYDPAGRELWRSWHVSRQYDGSRSLAADSAGNVYITSLGTGPFSGRNIAFIKYDSLGNRLAMVQYNGFENSDDLPSALAVDAAGNVFVTGTSSGVSPTGLDFVLVKYSQNAVPGLPVITAVPQSIDVARGSNAIFSVTATGDTPLSYQWLFNGNVLSGATNSAFALSSAQFEHAGSYSVRVVNARGMVISPAAVLTVQAPPMILIQPQTQAAVAGSTVLLSVTADGSTPLFYQWFANGVALSNDIINRILTLPNVQPGAGGNYEVVVSNRVGSVRSAPARLIVTLAAQQRWEARYNAPPGDNIDALQAMAVGRDGSVYVTGFSVGPSGADYLTAKYDTNGAQLWLARYDGNEGGHDFPADIAVDRDGNAYVTGRSWGGASGVDVATVKYDPNGTELWAARFNSPDNLEDSGRAIALDTNGNVYVAGSVIDAPFNQDFLTIRYGTTGTQLWMAQYDGAANGTDEAVDIALDGQGHVYIAGTSATNGFNSDFGLVKYSSSGTRLWSASYTASINSDETAVKLRVDEAGNAYIGGVSRNPGALPDYAVVKYSPAGARLWTFRHDGVRHPYDFLSDLVVDSAGHVYVTGTSASVSGGSDYVTLKLNPSGQRLWLATYGGPAGTADLPATLTFDSSGNLCVAGSINTSERIGAVTFCYDTNGNRLWTGIYAGPPNNHYAAAIAAGEFGHVFVAGSCVNADQSDYFIVKYSQADVAGSPVIVSPPRDQSAIITEDATFSALACGDSPLLYRWLFARSSIAEANFQTNVSIRNVTDAVAGYYSVEVFNSLGWVASPAAELRVNGPAVPRFQSIQFTNDYTRLVLLGERGFTYEIEASTDLLNWSIIGTTSNQNSSVEFLDSYNGAGRFYRAVKLP
jgi:uncharacterized delta-60 repeat protein